MALTLFALCFNRVINVGNPLLKTDFSEPFGPEGTWCFELLESFDSLAPSWPNMLSCCRALSV